MLNYSTLVNNNYPKKVINSTINSTLSRIHEREIFNDNIKKPQLNFSKIITITYIKNISKRIIMLLNKYGLKTIYKKGLPIRSLLTKYRSNNILENNNLAYNINCRNCDAVYTRNKKENQATEQNNIKVHL